MSMPPNPAGATPLGYAQAPRNDLRTIAVRQRAIMYCILAYIVSYAVVVFSMVEQLPILAGIAALCVFGMMVTAAVFVFMLSLSVYSQATGIVLGILVLIPMVGLIPLLIINGSATKILRAHGVRVGLMGANPKLVPIA